ncbi:MAG: beta-lactamase family protein [Nocardiopsaceae bacterium]|nr:beta-lactamase family protein [Nocardiopsaceae bacterium]
MIGGTCDTRFEVVRAAFAANFNSLGETGAAVCVTASGRPVVDMWGGWTDASRTNAWGPDTLVNFFSVGKGILAVLAARYAGTGELDPDQPVARYWPEFGAEGKDTVTVRQLLSHQAGVPAISHRLPPGAMLDWDVMTSAIAAQAPWWAPGTAHGYHVNTFGFAVGEVLRRASGRTVGALVSAQIARPLGADVYIGLHAREHHRVADFDWPGAVADETDRTDLAGQRLMEHNAYFNPGGLSGAGVVNTASWRAAEVPATNGHGTARGIARVDTARAAAGTADGVRIVDQGALADATAEQVYGDDRILHRRSRFGLGFQLTQAERPMGPSPAAFGHFGAGGSLGFCDPDAGLAIAYVTSQMGPRWQNPRNRALIDAVYSCL